MDCPRLLARAARTLRRRGAYSALILIAVFSGGLLLPLNAATSAPLDPASVPATTGALLRPDAEGVAEVPVPEMNPTTISVDVPLAGADRVLAERVPVDRRNNPSPRAAIATSQSASNSDAAPGIISRPVPGAVSSGYGYRTHPIHGGQRLHTGWDMTAGCGVPIKSGAAGRVIMSGWYGGYGNAIIVDHGGGVSTLYAHQSSLSVAQNEEVSAGQTIGLVGTTGMSTGCHLHYEVRIDGTPVDPTPYMSAAQSVLFVGGAPQGGAVRVG